MKCSAPKLASLAGTAALLAGCALTPPSTGTSVPAPPSSPAAHAATPAAPTPAGTASGAPAPASVPTLFAVQTLLNSPTELDIAVFGDSTGDEMTEWPALWATEMSSDHAVTLNRWITSSGRYEERVLSGDGPHRTVWNCSVSGWKPSNFYDHVDDCLPEAPDVVVISLGHNNNSDPTQALPQLQTLLGLVRDQATPDVPIVITMQNQVTTPERLPAADEVTRLIAEWAIEEKYPIIDVYHAFTDAPGGAGPLLKPDGLHPNEAGSVLWADTVVETLTPWRS